MMPPEQQLEAGEDEKHSLRKCQRQPRSQHTPIVRAPRPFRKRAGLGFRPSSRATTARKYSN